MENLSLTCPIYMLAPNDHAITPATKWDRRTLHGCVVPVWPDTPVECTDLLLPRFETEAPNLKIRVALIPHGVLGKPVPSIHTP